MKYVVTVLEDVAGISSTYLPIKAAISLLMDACDQVPLMLPKMQDQKLLTLRSHSFSRCSRALESVPFGHYGGQYVKNKPWHTNVNSVWLTLTYQNATIYEKPETQNRRLQLTGEAKPGKTRGLTGMVPGLAHQVSAGPVFGRVWNWTDLFLVSIPGTLAGYPDPLPTLDFTPAPMINDPIYGQISYNCCFSNAFMLKVVHNLKIVVVGIMRASWKEIAKHVIGPTKVIPATQVKARCTKLANHLDVDFGRSWRRWTRRGRWEWWAREWCLY